MKKRTISLTITILLLLMVLFLLGVAFFFPISAAERDNYLHEHQTTQLSAIGTDAADNIQLLDSRTDRSLEVQLWQITANGQLYYDVVVWQHGLFGKSRIVYTTWFAQEDIGNERISFGFHHRFYWYSYVTTLDFQLSAPRKTFHLF